jgi:putative Ig domain-containing protein
VSLSAAGTLGGTPKSGAGGVYPITITAANGIGTAATRRFSLTVDKAAEIISVNHATFALGKRGLLTVRTTGFPMATVREQGALPAGVRFTAEKNGQATTVHCQERGRERRRPALHATGELTRR